MNKRTNEQKQIMKKWERKKEQGENGRKGEREKEYAVKLETDP